MHTAALEHCGLEGRYELLDIAPADLNNKIKDMIEAGYTGFNVTIPHKDAIYSMASAHTTESSLAQASNTVKIQPDGTLFAHNTDIGGFEESVAERLPDRQKRGTACVLGTGGAAKAAIIALSKLRFENIFIVSRDADRASGLAQSMLDLGIQNTGKLSGGTWQEIRDGEITAIVNSTPMGQNSVPLPDWLETLFGGCAPSTVVFDMVYSKSSTDTALVSLAKHHNLQAYDGAEMLIRQAHKAFQFWTGALPPVDVFRAAFRKSIAHHM